LQFRPGNSNGLGGLQNPKIGYPAELTSIFPRVSRLMSQPKTFNFAASCGAVWSV